MIRTLSYICHTLNHCLIRYSRKPTRILRLSKILRYIFNFILILKSEEREREREKEKMSGGEEVDYEAEYGTILGEAMKLRSERERRSTSNRRLSPKKRGRKGPTNGTPVYYLSIRQTLTL